MTDHADATVQLLRLIIARLHAGETPENLGAIVVLIGRMMERKT
jgi:hypothetical protein